MFETLPHMLLRVMQTQSANSSANSFAYCEREATQTEQSAAAQTQKWHYLSYPQFYQQVVDLALAFKHLGLQRAARVAIMAEPSPFWLSVDLAVMALGAVSVPIFSHIAPDILAYQLDDADVHWCFIDGEEQWTLASKNAERWQVAVLHNAQSAEPYAYTLSTLLHLGAQQRAGLGQTPDAIYQEMLASVAPSDLATIIYTSGSTGMPKGVCLSQGNIASQLHAAAQRYPLDPASDKALSCLPLAHVFERMVMYFYVSRGISIFFADDIQNLGVLLREVQPTCVTMVPRLLEKVYAKILDKAASAHLLKRKIAEWAFSLARENDPQTAADSWSFQIAEHLVYQQLREALGGKITYIIVGGARLSPDLQRFFINIGLPLYVGYGLSEASPVIAANYPGHNQVGTVGPLFPGIELRFGDADEIQVRGPNIMHGYLNLADKTAAVIDADGWLQTGDCGSLENGFLRITGRIKELMKTSNGKYVAPVPIEQKLSESPIVDMAMLIAEGQKYVSCLLFPDLALVQQLKQEQGSSLSDSEFLGSAFMRQAIEKLLDSVNLHLNNWEQVRAYRFVSKAPSIAGGELTPTMKLRRHIVEEKYAALIAELYSTATSAE